MENPKCSSLPGGAGADPQLSVIETHTKDKHAETFKLC